MESGPDGSDAPLTAGTVRDWRWALVGVGKTLVGAGLLIIAFVAYQLWGTGIEFRASQRDLAREFRRTVEAATPAAVDDSSMSTPGPNSGGQSPGAGADAGAGTPGQPATGTTTMPPAPTTTIDPLERLKAGDVLAALKIPAISDTTYYVVSGVRYVDLKRGIGHYLGTSLPGQYGNAALAGHRTTYGAPFENLDQLQVGDLIVVDTVNGGHYEYRVESQRIVDPDAVEVLLPPADPEQVMLTLTTCHPKRSVAQRLIIVAHLNLETSSAVMKRGRTYSKRQPAAPAVTSSTAPTTAAPSSSTTASNPATTSAQPAPTTAVSAPPTDSAVAEPAGADAETGADPSLAAADDLVAEQGGDLAAGWFKDRAAWPHVIVWGLVLLAVAVATSVARRRTGHRWWALAVGSLPFLFVLYFFFQNVNRLLPPGL